MLFFDCLNNINITLTKHIYIKRKTISSAIKILSLEGVPPFQVYSCDYALNNCQLVATLENPVQAINDIILPNLFDNSPNIIVKIISFDGCETFTLLNCENFPTPMTMIVESPDSSNTIFELPLVNDGVYDFDVDWGDGTSQRITQWDDANKVHNYPDNGEYEIKIYIKEFTGWNFAYAGVPQETKNNLKSITIIPSLVFTDMVTAFTNCENLISFNGTPTFSGSTDLTDFFANCYSLESVNGIWDFSGVESISSFFFNCNSLTGGTINEWGLTMNNVKYAYSVFENCYSFNGELDKWNMSGVISMGTMFTNAVSFNQDIGGWNVSGVTEMDSMFYNATSFNQDLSGWCVTNIPTAPVDFDGEALLWVLPRPVWGTCPT